MMSGECWFCSEHVIDCRCDMYKKVNPYESSGSRACRNYCLCGACDPCVPGINYERESRYVCPKCSKSQSWACESENTVEHPNHYQSEIIEAIDVIEAFGLGFNLGNVVKYVLRAGKKGDRREDLEKAKWYLDREINGL